ncbi:uncharacterized protein LOC144661936 isoform X1 [Oculina patagonica]
MSENDISEVTCDVGEMSDNSLEVTRSCDPTISMPIEKVYPLDVDSSSKAVATEATCNVCVNAISEVTCDIGEMSDHSLAVTDSSFLEQALMGNSIMETEEALAVRPWQGLRVNISMPIEDVSQLDVHDEPSEAVTTVESFHLSEDDISEVNCEISERSVHSFAVKGSPLLDGQKSTEDTEKASSISENEINGVTYDYGEISDISLSVAGSSALNISTPNEMGSSLDEHESRKRKRSCENCLDEDFVELLIKRRRLLDIEGSSVSEYSNGEMGLKYPEGNSLEKHISSGHTLVLKESFEANVNMPTETVSSLANEMSGHSLAVTGSPVANVSAPIEKRFFTVCTGVMSRCCFRRCW